MKKVFVIAFGLFFISLLAVYPAQAQENAEVRKMLVGEWKLGDIQYSETYLDRISEEEKKAVESMVEQLKGSSFNLMDNGGYEIKMNLAGNENSNYGKWKIDRNGKNFITIDEKGKEISQIIEEIGKNKLILKDEEITLTLVK